MAASALSPRLMRQHELTRRWLAHGPIGWSPRELTDTWFPSSLDLTVKCSSSRFFMYEEHSNEKLHDNNSPVNINQHSPNEFADILCDTSRNDYHYWTSPIRDVSPSLLKERFEGYESLYSSNQNSSLLDPRGPSLWMGSSGSSTQAHYDVADNVILQLYGNKRIRMYPPSAACALHVFPDAHPKARKSQVDFDQPDTNRHPHFAFLSEPALDVVLQPGDALQIPAFWFHHLENGQQQTQHTSSPSSPSSSLSRAMADGPSVSLNLFALSAPMQTAQRIFRDGSAPFPSLVNLQRQQHQQMAGDDDEDRVELAAAALRKLGWALLEGLGVKDCPGSVIRQALLDTRYKPLGLVAAPYSSNTNSIPPRISRNGTISSSSARSLMSSSENQMLVETCMASLLPQFASLAAQQSSSVKYEDRNGYGCYGGVGGVVLLVACHLMELWAVEIVGASDVESVWDRALRE